QLIAPNDAPLAVDRADPVAVAVEGDAEIEVLFGDQPAQVLQVFRDGGIGMMVREIAVHFGIEREMFAGELGDERFERRTGGAVAGVPTDTHRFKPRAVDALQTGKYPIDVIVEDLPRLDSAGSVVPIARRRHPADRLDVLAAERAALTDHLESLVIGGIVAAGYLDAAVHLFGRGFGIIEHGRRAHADPAHIATARIKPFDQRVLEHRGTHPAIVA